MGFSTRPGIHILWRRPSTIRALLRTFSILSSKLVSDTIARTLLGSFDKYALQPSLQKGEENIAELREKGRKQRSDGEDLRHGSETGLAEKPFESVSVMRRTSHSRCPVCAVSRLRTQLLISRFHTKARCVKARGDLVENVKAKSDACFVFHQIESATDRYVGRQRTKGCGQFTRYECLTRVIFAV